MGSCLKMLVSTIIVCSIFMGEACTTSEVSETSSLSNPLPEAYQEILSAFYTDTQSGIDLDANRDLGRSYSGLFFGFLGDARNDVPASIRYDYTKDPLQDYGFTTIDLDDDGTMELIITSCEKETVFYYPGMDSVDGYYIYDLYTIIDGRTVKIIGMSDPLCAYLTEDKHILVESYIGYLDTEHYFTEYELLEADLVFVREVRAIYGVYDGYHNNCSQFLMFNSLEEKQIMNNWYYGCKIVGDYEYFTGYTGLGVDRYVIEETQFSEFINENSPIELEVTSFEEYFG